MYCSVVLSSEVRSSALDCVVRFSGALFYTLKFLKVCNSALHIISGMGDNFRKKDTCVASKETRREEQCPNVCFLQSVR